LNFKFFLPALLLLSIPLHARNSSLSKPKPVPVVIDGRPLTPLCSTGGALRIYGRRYFGEEITMVCRCLGRQVKVPSMALDGGWVGCDGEIETMCFKLSRRLTGKEWKVLDNKRKLPAEAEPIDCPPENYVPPPPPLRPFDEKTRLELLKDLDSGDSQDRAKAESKILQRIRITKPIVIELGMDAAFARERGEREGEVNSLIIEGLSHPSRRVWFIFLKVLVKTPAPKEAVLPLLDLFKHDPSYSDVVLITKVLRKMPPAWLGLPWGTKWSTTGMPVPPPEYASFIGEILTLKDGRLLLIGNDRVRARSFKKTFAPPVWILDPAEKIWTPVKSPLSARDGHKGVLLPDGRVLVAAGSADGWRRAYYLDPNDATWTKGPVIESSRIHVLPGNRAAVMAWKKPGFQILDNKDRAVTGRFPAPENAREFLTVSLPSHEILALGGQLKKPHLFDPSGGVWRPVAEMNNRLEYPQVTALGSSVLVMGWNPDRTLLAEIFDPEKKRWRVLPAPPFRELYRPQVVLSEFEILIFNELGAHLFNLQTGRWTLAAPLQRQRRIHFAAAPLPEKKVLIVSRSAPPGIYDPFRPRTLPPETTPLPIPFEKGTAGSDDTPELASRPLSEPIMKLVDSLRSKQWDLVELLVKLGPAVIPELINGLEHKNPDVRTYAAMTLGKMGTDAHAAAPALARLLNNQNDPARGQAANALRRIRSTDPFVLAALEKSAAGGNAAAGNALNTLSPKTSVTASVRALSHKNPQVRVNSILTLKTQGPEAVEAAVASLIEVLKKDPAKSVRSVALDALGIIKTPGKFPIQAVTDATKDPDPWIRMAAARTLGQFGWHSGGKALDTLTELLKHEEAVIRYGALTGLGQIDSTAARAAAKKFREENMDKLLADLRRDSNHADREMQKAASHALRILENSTNR